MNRLLKSPLLLRLYRVGILVAIVFLIHQQARWFEAQRGATISLRLARKFFPEVNRVQLRDPERGLHFVTDARGNTIGCLLTTSPFTDNIIGYSGPNNLVIALDSRGIITGLELLNSGDTDEHVRKVQRDPNFFQRFIGWRPNEEPAPRIEAVSGATLTSFAIAEAVQQRLAGAAPSLRFPDPITLDEVRVLFTNAVSVVPEGPRLRVLDASGHVIGFVLRTSPQADNVSGWRGPSDSLVALGLDGRTITGLHVRKSYDTDSYVDGLRRNEQFLKEFVGRNIEALAARNFSREKIEGVSGATQTARAIAEGVERRFKAEIKAQANVPQWQPKPRDWALASVIAGAFAMSFTSLRGHRWVRVAWQLLLVGYVGLVNHDLLSLDLLAGWLANGLALKAAPSLVLLAAAALLVPWTARRQLYCHQICPHGAAQQLLGSVGSLFRIRSSRRKEALLAKSKINQSLPAAVDSPRRWILPAQAARALEFIPIVLLAVALLALLIGLPLNLASLEPFDAWVWRTAGIATLVIAGVGLAASLFIPQAYCRFGCPTGALLNFVRSSGSADLWGRRDWTALAFVAVALIAVVTVRTWPNTEPPPEPLSFNGRTMGTTWSVKIHDEVANPAIVERAIKDEFEWVESLTLHWRTNTDLSAFNRTLTTNALPMPWPVLTLSRRAAEISRLTEGAYDITVGSLVRLWGFGPGPRRTEPPNDAEIAAALPAVGWQRLEVLDGQLRKQHPALEVDLSSIGVGWAVDRIARVLDRNGFTNYLVEAGGELRAQGRWTIAIEHPARTCTLTNESIGTSGTYRRNFQSGGRQFSHLIDPRTGRPITHNTVSVSVRHADCATADAWAAALNVLGVEAGLPLAERQSLAAQFVVEQSNGKLDVRQTAAWAATETAVNVVATRKR